MLACLSGAGSAAYFPSGLPVALPRPGPGSLPAVAPPTFGRAPPAAVPLSAPVVGQNSVATLDSGRQGSEAGRQMPLVLALLGALRAALGARSDLVLENLALRQQLALLRRRAKRPRFGQLDRLFWMWLSHRSVRWREALHVVQPQTVIRWHRQGFRAFWNWKSRRGPTGRPPVNCEVAKLVRTMALTNPLWGAPRIHGELLKLGLDVSQRTVVGSCLVARNDPRRPGEPSSRTTSSISSLSTSSWCPR